MKPCVYIEITCPKHEEVRLVLREFPLTEIVVCPGCGYIRPWTMLGAGMTCRELPFHEVLREHRNWNLQRILKPAYRKQSGRSGESKSGYGMAVSVFSAGNIFTLRKRRLTTFVSGAWGVTIGQRT